MQPLEPEPIGTPRSDDGAGPVRAMSAPTSGFVIEDVAIDELRPDRANPRRISEASLERLEASVGTFGLVQPILARRADGTVIGGHQRLLVARRRGLATVPVIWLDLDPDEARTLALGLNRIGGEWDDELLARLLGELATSAVDLRVTGFDDGEVRLLLRSLAIQDRRDRPEAFDVGAALEAAAGTPRTQPGDRWILGEHRLVCGDATRAADLGRLLGGQRAAMALTDPPYNVRLGGHGSMGNLTGRRRIRNDALDEAAWETFCRAWVRSLLGAVDGPLYVFMSSQELPLVSRVLASEGGHWSDTIIWRKDRFTPGRADYQRAYEPIWYGWPSGVRHPWYGDRRQTDVWDLARPARSPLHPAAKPLEVLERAIGNSSRAGELVLDLFGGSGSTLIACERTGRSAALLELDPRYCDVTIARWEVFSGQTAILDPDAAPAASRTG